MKINKYTLAISIILLVVVILGFMFIFNAIFEDGKGMRISLLSMSSKYGDKWNDTFKYKNGVWSHSFNIRDKTNLNASWDVDKGHIEANLYNDDKLIKEINSMDNTNYKEIIDLSEYKGDKVVLKLKFKKTYGKIKFFLE